MLSSIAFRINLFYIGLRKYFIILFISTISTFQAYSQLLQGEWEGNFTENGTVWPIYLDFKLNADSSYTVYSYSKSKTVNGTDSVVTCLVYYKFLSQDSLYLEEIEVIEPIKYPTVSCFQKMILQIKPRKKFIELVGQWESTTTICNSSGEINFRRKRVY
jgi:hypothetical protein